MSPMPVKGGVQLIATASKAGLFSKCRDDNGGDILGISNLRQPLMPSLEKCIKMHHPRKYLFMCFMYSLES